VCDLLPYLFQVLALLLRPDGSLEAAYTDAERNERRAQNVPFILLHHLDHTRCTLLAAAADSLPLPAPSISASRACAYVTQTAKQYQRRPVWQCITCSCLRLHPAPNLLSCSPDGASLIAALLHQLTLQQRGRGGAAAGAREGAGGGGPAPHAPAVPLPLQRRPVHAALPHRPRRLRAGAPAISEQCTTT